MTVAMRAMPRASGPLALRVAIVRGGSIEREWFVKEGVVTFGASLDADVVVPGASVACATLFDVGERTELVVPEGVSGRALVAREQIALTTARTLTLDETARGRVLLAGSGDTAVAVLFQRVPAPVERTKPSLPASVRGGVLDRVDWLFTAIAAASFMTHFAVVIGLQSADFPMPPSLAEIDDRYAEVLLTDATPPPPPMVDDDDPSLPSEASETPSTPEHTAPDHVASPTHTPSHAPSSAPSGDEQAAIDAVAHAEATHAVEEVIGHIGTSGVFADMLRNGGPTDSAADVMAQVEGVQIASRDPGAIGIRTGHPSGTEHGLEGLRTATGPVGPRDEGEQLTERHVQVHVDPIIDDPMEPTFDQRALVAAIRHRLPAIQRCYEMQLSHSSGLAGRLTVSMQVEQVGSLSHVEISEDTVGSRALDECVIGNIRSIRLATGPSEAVTVEYPLVFAPQS